MPPTLRGGGVHGNFDNAQTLNNGGHGVTVTGWVAWDAKAGEPDTCRVTVEVTQTSGPGSAKAYGESPFYPRHDPDVHVPWSAPATTPRNGDALRAAPGD